ncbi:MAG: hypothetical protein IT518_23650 [Burkholderiales bacterium]|nr:hypothetical protein [Burkholderiales bacterium]
MRLLALLAGLASAIAFAGPVDVYLDGPRYCPQDLPLSGPRITEAQAIARTQKMLPDGFCGPSLFVSGCTYDVENEYDSWRVYVHQYKDTRAGKDKGGLKHTYLILDRVGNCVVHIPGTEFGALN